MITLDNELLKVEINEKGAELSSLYHKKNNLEYLWSGDTAFWAKKSPVLFPIVGMLKNDTFYFSEKTYHLSRHGFAREMMFVVTEQTGSSATFTLESSESTLTQYPFQFRFDIVYSIREGTLNVLYRVINNSDGPLYFSVGGHPAFKIPLSPGLAYNDYFLEFGELENSARWPISVEGLIEKNPVPFFNQARRIPLTKELFYKDALVFKDLCSTSLKLLCSKSTNGLAFDFAGFPFLGIWAAKNADFVCIEPWCGIADSVNTNQQFAAKEGINRLHGQQEFKRDWSVTVF